MNLVVSFLVGVLVLVLGVAAGPMIRHELAWRKVKRETLPERFRDLEGQ